MVFTESDPTKDVCTMAFRHVVYSYLKLSDGFSLIAGIDQRGTMGVVEVVVPNIPEAKQMVLMMNKQIAAFMVHYLKDQGMNEDFLLDLQTRHHSQPCDMK